MTDHSDETSIDYERLLVERLAKMPQKYLICRDVRHIWKVTQELHLEGQISGRQRVERVLECSRCGTVKIEHFALQTSYTGVQRLKSVGYRYTYPKEYRVPEMSRADAPREILRAQRFIKAGQP